MVPRSLCGLLCSLWPYSLVGSSPGGPFSNVSGFSSSCLEVPGGLPRVFFSSPVAFLSFSRVPCMPSASLLSGNFWWLCLSSVCGALSCFYPGFPAILLVLPLSLLVFDLFLILPRLTLQLFLPLLCLSVGASWCVSSYGFVVGWASCFLVLCCGCYLFVFLLASPLAIVLLCCSPLGVVSLGSCSAGASCQLVLLPVLIFTP